MSWTRLSPIVVCLFCLFKSMDAAGAETPVCVDVVLQQMEEAATPAVGDAPTPAPAEAAPANASGSTVNALIRRALAENDPVLPLGQTPVLYLKRLIEHFVTHEPGFVAVDKDCPQRIRVELYPLIEGWTVFARYSGNGREERVDRLYSRELSQFAERAVLALLKDVPISTTVNRENVLASDSKEYEQRIKGTHHFIFDVGTQVRFWQFATAVTDAGESNFGGVQDKWRAFTPMTLAAGYRGKFETWGLQALAQIGIGISKIAPRKNPDGGHIDFGGNAGLQLHFLRYLDPRGLTSFYFGGGSTFEMMWFSAIRNEQKSGADRSYLFAGGLDIDLVCGWEFMRASSVQFYLQGGLHLPAYALQTENNDGSVKGWFPGASVKLGVMF